MKKKVGSKILPADFLFWAATTLFVAFVKFISKGLVLVFSVLKFMFEFVHRFT